MMLTCKICKTIAAVGGPHAIGDDPNLAAQFYLQAADQIALHFAQHHPDVMRQLQQFAMQFLQLLCNKLADVSPEDSPAQTKMEQHARALCVFALQGDMALVQTQPAPAPVNGGRIIAP